MKKPRLFDSEEIRNYAENDGEFNELHIKPALKLLIQRKIDRKYDPEEALGIFRKLADLAAQSFHKEIVAQEPKAFQKTSWKMLFLITERNKAAKHWEKEFRSKIDKGLYGKIGEKYFYGW